MSEITFTCCDFGGLPGLEEDAGRQGDVYPIVILKRALKRIMAVGTHTDLQTLCQEERGES